MRTIVSPNTTGASSETWRVTFSRFSAVRKVRPVVRAKAPKIGAAISKGHLIRDQVEKALHGPPHGWRTRLSAQTTARKTRPLAICWLSMGTLEKNQQIVEDA